MSEEKQTIDAVQRLRKAILDRDFSEFSKAHFTVVNYCRRALFQGDRESLARWYPEISSLLIWFFRTGKADWPETERPMGGLELLLSLMGNFLESRTYDESRAEVRRSGVDCEILLALSRSSEGLRSGDLAHRIGKEQNSVTNRLPGLERRGFLVRSRVGKNSIVYLTPKGKDVAASLGQDREDVVCEHLDEESKVLEFKRAPRPYVEEEEWRLSQAGASVSVKTMGGIDQVLSISTDAFQQHGPRSTITGKRSLRLEAKAIYELATQLDETFDEAVNLILKTSGRIILTGMGKSGHVARKISATFASTGTPSFFVHPCEAGHGDLGMIFKRDAVIALSNSGETAELSSIIEYSERLSIPLIAMTSNPDSTLARYARCTLVTPKFPEACPHGLAPTTSTTMMLALGDALAIALLERRGFSAQDFRVFHPGGSLGAKLQLVKDLMHREDEIPLVTPDTNMRETVIIMTTKRLGCAGVVKKGRLVGIITDGDLRKHMDKSLIALTAREVMTPNPRTIPPGALAAEAVAIMQKNHISNLFVLEAGCPVGVLHLHDCLRAGLE